MMKKEMLRSLSGLVLKDDYITVGFSPDSGKTRGGGCGMILTSCHHVEVRLDSFCLLNGTNSATC